MVRVNKFDEHLGAMKVYQEYQKPWLVLIFKACMNIAKDSQWKKLQKVTLNSKPCLFALISWARKLFKRDTVF